MRSLSKNVSIECFPPMNEMKTFLNDFSVPYISWFFRFDIFVSFSWFAGFTYGHTLFALMKQIPQTIDEILLVLLHTFPYTKNDFVIHNSKIPGYQSHHTRNVIIHPQKNCSVHFSTKNKENLLLPKVYESKRVQIGIGTLQINFSCWKKTYQLIWLSG